MAAPLDISQSSFQQLVGSIFPQPLKDVHNIQAVTEQVENNGHKIKIFSGMSPKRDFNESPAGVKALNVLHSLNRSVVEDRIDHCDKTEQSALLNLKIVLDNHDSVLLDFPDTSPHRPVTRMRKRYCGEKEWHHILSFSKLTEPDLCLIHAVFMLKQKKGVISMNSFWELIRFFHGFEASLVSDVVLINLDLSPTIEPSVTPRTRSYLLNANSISSNIQPRELAKMRGVVNFNGSPAPSLGNLACFRSLDAPPISTDIDFNLTYSSFSAISKANVTSTPSISHSAYPDISRRNSFVTSDFAGSPRPSFGGISPRKNITDFNSFLHDDCTENKSHFSFSKDSLPGLCLKNLMNNFNFLGRRVTHLADLKGIGELNFLHFALLFTIITETSIMPLPAFIFEVLDVNTSRKLSSNNLISFFTETLEDNIEMLLPLSSEIHDLFNFVGKDFLEYDDFALNYKSKMPSLHSFFKLDFSIDMKRRLKNFVASICSVK